MSSVGRVSVLFIALLAVTVPAIAQAPAATAPPAPQYPPAKSGPTLAEATRALAAAEAAAMKMKLSLSCVVVDPQGYTIALHRMDGARLYTTEVARGKAIVSALFGRASGAMAASPAAPHLNLLREAAPGPFFPVQGALPLVRDGMVHGALGCSGASAAQDEQAAQAGLAALP
jgi:glc operon protein GlcG